MTPAQQKTLDAWRSLVDEHGYPPSIRELCARMGKSRATVHHHLSELKRSGIIESKDNCARTVRVRESA